MAREAADDIVGFASTTLDVPGDPREAAMSALPTGETRLFPVLGDPIAQVRSPQRLTQIMRARGHDAIVVPIHTSSAHLNSMFHALAGAENVGGMLITVPHKRDAYLACEAKTDRAAFVETVNVMRRTKNGWLGDNTDGIGYLDGIGREGFDVREKRVLLVGCGGAGSAIALEFMQRGVRHLDMHDIDTHRRDGLIERLTRRFQGQVGIGSDHPGGYDLIANATPLGMRLSDPLPVDVSKLEAWQFVACVVTKPDVPPLLREARRRGCATMIGTGMFDAQAERLADFLLHQGEYEAG